MEQIIRVIDLETGPDPVEGEPGIIEYGHIDVIAKGVDMLGNPYDWEVGTHTFHTFDTLVKPHAPIPHETSAIHNITDAHVVNAKPWSEIGPYVRFVNSPGKRIVALAAHNIECERKLIGEYAGDLPWIDTYKIALRLWPEAMSHSNNAIRYYLNPEGLDPHLAAPVHRALPDAYITAFTLREALKGHSYETLVQWSREPALLVRCKIGDRFRNNGKGTPWKDVDSGFLQWILTKDFDEDTKHTARFHLEQREMDQRNEWERQQLNQQFRANGMSEVQSFAANQPETSTDAETPKPAPRDVNTMELDL